MFDVTRRRNAPLAPEGTDIDQLTADLLVSELTGVRLQGHLGDATFDEELATMASEGHVFDDGETFDVIARMGDRLVVVQLEVDDDEFAIAQLHVATVSDVDATVYGDKATLHVPRGPLVLDSPVEDVPALVQLLAR